MTIPSHPSQQNPLLARAARRQAGDVPFDYEAIFKLPAEARYMNVSVWWIPYYPQLVRLLYVLRIRHEVVTIGSLVCGLSGAYWIATAESYAGLLIAAGLVHLKDVLDASDGALARLTGTGHRLGRFMDTIGDGLAFTTIIIALAVRSVDAGQPTAPAVILAFAAWLSLFVQCSYFNFYHLQYTRIVGASSMSQLRESHEDPRDDNSPWPGLVRVLQRVYQLWFGWQDRLVAWVDRVSRGASSLPGEAEASDTRWFGSAGFLTANSALCFGTHIFLLILCLLAGRPEWFLPVVAVALNIYLGGVIAARIRFRG